jgi:copper oxidase (laccase) domain-containing protein
MTSDSGSYRQIACCPVTDKMQHDKRQHCVLIFPDIKPVCYDVAKIVHFYTNQPETALPSHAMANRKGAPASTFVSASWSE